LKHLKRKLARAQKGSNRRAAVKTSIAKLKARETDRRKDWAEKLSTDLARRQFDIWYACNADVNAAKNIAAGRAVTARGGHRTTGPLNREPQLLLPTV
jgi:transposase